MIVKKMPILQGFPDIETVKNLSNFYTENEDFIPLFYDIETTGLARNSTFLYLVGAVLFEAGTWQFYQWFAENPEEEPLILTEFSKLLQTVTHTIQYNGNHFDEPYLLAHLKLHDLPNAFDNKPALDLYQTLKPLKALLKLADLKQPTLETFLKRPKRNASDGQACIRLYRQYVKKPEQGLAETIMLHNEEDLLGLGQIFQTLSYLCLYRGEYKIASCAYEEDSLLVILKTDTPLPAEFSNGSKLFYITGCAHSLRLRIFAPQKRLRRYYENYKDYDYLPLEDTAMPKILTSHIEKSFKQTATPQTCYTWFACDEKFLASPALQQEYLKHALPVFLCSLTSKQ